MDAFIIPWTADDDMTQSSFPSSYYITIQTSPLPQTALHCDSVITVLWLVIRGLKKAQLAESTQS